MKVRVREVIVGNPDGPRTSDPVSTNTVLAYQSAFGQHLTGRFSYLSHV
jgi:hypothetical protein